MSNITRYFHAQNCNRPHLPVRFHQYATVGTPVGVAETADVHKIEALLKLVEDKASAVTEIEEAEYNRILKKNVPKAPAPEKLVEKAVAGEPVKDVETALQVGQVGDVTKPTAPVPPPETTNETAEPPKVRTTAEILTAKSNSELRLIILGLNDDPTRTDKIVVANNAPKAVLVTALVNAGYTESKAEPPAPAAEDISQLAADVKALMAAVADAPVTQTAE